MLVQKVISTGLRTRPMPKFVPRQRYTFVKGSLLYCRDCERLRPHTVVKKTGVACLSCGRETLTIEVVATYSADEYTNPAPITLPWRLLPREVRAERIEATLAQEAAGGA
jgi:hypothetical protein